MRIFLAGATGAIGKRLLPMLVAAGHQVTGTTRTLGKSGSIRSAGAQAEVVDALNKRSVIDAVERTQPEVIIHELTAIPTGLNLKRFDEDFALTNMLRTEGTDHLLAAARQVGCRRFIAQSFAPLAYERNGSWVKNEEDARLSTPEPEARKTLEAIFHLESAVSGQTAMQGFILRYGWFYGPGTSLGGKGGQLGEIRKRRIPIVGKGSGHWSFVHISDAAAATLAAVTASSPGVYNICDDEPAPVSTWLPYLAEAIGAKPPRHIPKWLGRLAIGDYGVALMNEIRGASNEKAKTLLRWKPRWPSWQQGFREGLDEDVREISVEPGFRKAS